MSPGNSRLGNWLLERAWTIPASPEFAPYYEFEARMLTKDGHWVWVLDRGKVVSQTDDKPLLMSGASRITLQETDR